VYEGQWQRDLRHGVGTARTAYESYRGEWVAGVRCGAGEHEVVGGYRIEGVWADDDIEHGVVRGRRSSLQPYVIPPAAVYGPGCNRTWSSMAWRRPRQGHYYLLYCCCYHYHYYYYYYY